MIHQPLGGARGPATDIKIELDEMMRTQNQLYAILAKHGRQERRADHRGLRP